MKLSLNWLKDYVQIKIAPDALAEGLTLAGLEVKNMAPVAGDIILETEITTNRPDWLSHLGVAREIHAIWGGRFVLPPLQNQRVGKVQKTIRVSIPKTDHDLCPYYSACLLEDVQWPETPGFMKKRLEQCGIRSINLAVDITNYVLLEFGQPLHAFDADRLKGNTIFARRSREGEKIVAIDESIYELVKDDLVIADEEGPIAICGIMGGRNSEVSHKTRNILLESAFFAPRAVRNTSSRLKLTSESSYRFERRVDPRGVDQARERAVWLFKKYAHIGKISAVFRAGKTPIREPRISLAYSETKRILGVDVPKVKVSTYLNRLGLRLLKKGSQSIIVQVPSFRSDLMGLAQ